MKPSPINTSRKEGEEINSSIILRLHSANLPSAFNLYILFASTPDNLRLSALARWTGFHSIHHPLVFTSQLLCIVSTIGAMSIDNMASQSQSGTSTNQTNQPAQLLCRTQHTYPTYFRSLHWPEHHSDSSLFYPCKNFFIVCEYSPPHPIATDKGSKKSFSQCLQRPNHNRVYPFLDLLTI